MECNHLWNIDVQENVRTHYRFIYMDKGVHPKVDDTPMPIEDRKPIRIRVYCWRCGSKSVPDNIWDAVEKEFPITFQQIKEWSMEK